MCMPSSLIYMDTATLLEHLLLFTLQQIWELVIKFDILIGFLTHCSLLINLNGIMLLRIIITS